MPHYVGSIDFFSGGHKHDGHGNAEEAIEGDTKKFDSELDITETVNQLNKDGAWDPKKLTVTLRPIAPVPPKELEAEKKKFYMESAKASNLSYDAIEIVTER